MNVEQARFNMIEQQIRPWDVLDASVLELLGRVRREDFVPAAHRALAFCDVELPLPDGQSMLSPKVEARLLQEARVERHEKVLEVGAGSGFMAALLAHRAQSVVTFERSAALAALARGNLDRAGIANATVRQADASKGLPEPGAFDAIVLSGSVAALPEALLAHLRPGGRLVGIVGTGPVMRAVRVERADDGAWRTTALFDTVAPRLAGFGEPSKFTF